MILLGSLGRISVMGKEANNSLSYQLFGVNFLSDQEKRGSGYNSFKEAKDTAKTLAKHVDNNCDFIFLIF